MEREKTGYAWAVECLPMRFRRQAMALPETIQDTAEEFRLRLGRPMTILGPEGETAPWKEPVERSDLDAVVNMATEYSRYASAEALRWGYLPAAGGCRIGLCGTVALRQGTPVDVRELTSLCIRVAREKRGIAAELAEQLVEDGRFASTLLLSPPGGGKTTLLRDLVRCLSDGSDTRPPFRVAVVDERGEIAVSCQGRLQMDVGRRTDVLDGCPKALGIPMVMRAMNPQIIAVDEITMAEDIRAMSAAAHCGVALLATMHAASLEEMAQRPLCRELLSADVFHRAVIIENRAGQRTYRVEAVGQ